MSWDSSEVGSGKYGEVLLGTLDGSSQTPTSVAVKELRTVGTRGVRKRVALRLARELKIWAKVNHPHILQLVGYYLSDDYETARLISPFMTNGNVSQYLEKLQVGVLERMNIANILMSDNLQAVLCDFGLASFVEESGISTGLTTSRSIKGSIRYMSPELLLEEDAKHTLESDIWAWGCTVFEIVTDCAPYNTVKGDRGLIMAFMREDPPGSTEILMSRLVDETCADAPPAFQSLHDCLTECWAFETEQHNSTTDDEFEPTPPPPPTPPPTGQTPPDPRPSPLISSVEGVPDLSDYIKKDNDAGRKCNSLSDIYVGHYKNPETKEQLPVALKLPRQECATQTNRQIIHFSYGSD
ncbi:hypothetical protein FRC05_010483 [Tulasnella sp. 425]|nr:hypothetical protein FRC05_010483 [Tulasnella sp. 425]